MIKVELTRLEAVAAKNGLKRLAIAKNFLNKTVERDVLITIVEKLERALSEPETNLEPRRSDCDGV